MQHVHGKTVQSVGRKVIGKLPTSGEKGSYVHNDVMTRLIRESEGSLNNFVLLKAF
jgi:hypothetical protein